MNEASNNKANIQLNSSTLTNKVRDMKKPQLPKNKTAINMFEYVVITKDLNDEERSKFLGKKGYFLMF